MKVLDIILSLHTCYTCAMRDTTAIEKLLPSALNATTSVFLSIPCYIYFDFSLYWKLSVIIIFYLLQIIDTNENVTFRCFGMRILGTVWEKKYSGFQRNLYSILYTLSFSTLFFWVYFPFDLLLINLLLIQLPTIYFSGTTLHGLLSGNIRSVTTK